MLSEHISYLSDGHRTRLFQRAIAETVQPGDNVLDLGCGVGVMGLLALKAGAGHVTGLDRTDVVDLARETMQRAGFSERSDFIKGKSNRIEADASYDLIVCDHVGYFALDYGLLRLLQDARSRFLKPGGRIIPAEVTLFLAPVDADTARGEGFGWAATDVPVEFNWLTTLSTNAKYAIDLTPEQVISSPAELGRVDLGTDDRDFLSFRAEFEVTRGGRLRGLAGWFECRLSKSVSMTNAPMATARINRPQAFFPIEEPIEVTAGDRLRATIAMRPDEHDFAWTVTHEASGRRFRQATLKGEVTDSTRLLAARPDRVPEPTDEARAARLLMDYCDGRRTAAEIEAAVTRDHPDLFATPAAITDFVRAWLAKYTR